MALQYCCIQIKLLPSSKYSFWWPWIPVTFDPHQGKKKMFLTCTLNTCDTCLIVQHLNSDISQPLHLKLLCPVISEFTFILKKIFYSANHPQNINNIKEHLLIHVFYQCSIICFCSYQYAAINQKLKNHSNLNTIQHDSYEFWFVLLAVNVKWSVYTSFFDRQTYNMYIQCNCSAVCEISLTIVCDFKLLIKFVRYSSGINSQFWVEPQHVVE